MQLLKLTCILMLPALFMACNSGSETDNSKSADTTNGNATVASHTDKKELMFVLADQTVSQGDTVCIDVTVRDFSGILSMQYSMNWDPKVLKFLNLDKMNLKDLSANNFGLNRISQGKIGTSWFDYAVQGISLQDGTAIYQVCFQAIGESGSSDQVFFSSEPVMIEVSNSAEELLGLAFRRAKITIQ